MMRLPISRRFKSQIVWGLLLVFLAAGSSDAQGPRNILDRAEIDPQIGQTIPLETKFLDHAGRETTLRKTLDAKPAILCLVYFQCPMLCKLAADGLVKALTEIDSRVGDDFQVILVSFDPRDTPPQAEITRKQLVRRYARPGTEQGWHCLTGETQAVETLMARIGFHAVWDENTKQFAHAAGIFLISPEGTITDCLNGVEFSPRPLAKAIDAARRGEVKPRVEGAAEAKPFLRCYIYDPTTGKFGAAVQWTIRVLGLGTVLAMVWGIARLIRHQPSSALEPELSSRDRKEADA